jgi:hypothetical protein
MESHDVAEVNVGNFGIRAEVLEDAAGHGHIVAAGLCGFSRQMFPFLTLDQILHRRGIATLPTVACRVLATIAPATNVLGLGTRCRNRPGWPRADAITALCPIKSPWVLPHQEIPSFGAFSVLRIRIGGQGCRRAILPAPGWPERHCRLSRPGVGPACAACAATVRTARIGIGPRAGLNTGLPKGSPAASYGAGRRPLASDQPGDLSGENAPFLGGRQAHGPAAREVATRPHRRCGSSGRVRLSGVE